jgi:hypothetical protein
MLPRDTRYTQKLAPTSPISGGRSVCTCRSQTKATELEYFIAVRSVVRKFWKGAGHVGHEPWPVRQTVNLGTYVKEGKCEVVPVLN